MLRLLTPLFIFILGLTISLYSYYTYADFSNYGAAFFPTIVGFLLSSFSIIDFLIELNIKNKYIFQSFNIKNDIMSILLTTSLIITYIFISKYIGFILTCSLILISFTIPLLKQKKLITAIFLIILSIAIYILFGKVLLVSLPTGILFY
ncbi:tripartite tricarboxylate transporter TctB family protein [Gallibacterium sp. ZY190522]